MPSPEKEREGERESEGERERCFSSIKLSLGGVSCSQPAREQAVQEADLNSGEQSRDKVCDSWAHTLSH